MRLATLRWRVRGAVAVPAMAALPSAGISQAQEVSVIGALFRRLRARKARRAIPPDLTGMEQRALAAWSRCKP